MNSTSHTFRTGCVGALVLFAASLVLTAVTIIVVVWAVKTALSL